MQGGEVDVEVEHCRLVSYTLYSSDFRSHQCTDWQ